MARHQYDPTQDGSRSVYEYRVKIEEQIEADLAAQKIKSAQNEAEYWAGVARDSASSAAYGLTSGARGDSADRALQETWNSATNTVKTAAAFALVLAGFAAESSFTKKLSDLEDYMHESNANETGQYVDDAMQRDKQTFAEYTASVREAELELLAAKNNSHTEYLSVKSEAQEKIAEANQTFNNESNRLLGEMSKSDEVYKHDIEVAQNKLDSARTESEISAAKAEIDRIEQRHTQEIQTITSQINEAAATQRTIVDQQNERIENARQQHLETVVEAKQNLNAMTEQREAFLNNTIALGDEYKTRLEQVANQNIIRVDENLYGMEAGNFVDLLDAKQSSIGQAIACQIGSKDEQDIINKVQADVDARAQFESDPKNAGLQYVSTVSDSDYAKAESIIQKYSGDLTSNDGLRNTIIHYEKSAAIIQGELPAAKELLKDRQASLSQISQQLKEKQEHLVSVDNDRRALLTGKLNGKPLTDEQRKEITDRLQKAGNTSELKKEISSLKNEQGKLKTEVAKAKKDVQEKQKVLKDLEGQLNLLQQHGKTIVETKRNQSGKNPEYDLATRVRMKMDPKFRRQIKEQEKQKAEGGSKKGEKRQDLAAKLILSSVSSMHHSFTKKLKSGDVVWEDRARRQASRNRVAAKYDKALKVGKHLLKGGKFVGSHAIKGIGKSTRLGQKMSKFLLTERGQKLTNIGIIAGVGTSVVGGKLLNGVSWVISPKRKIQQLKQELEKKAIKKGFRLARKGVGKVKSKTTRLTKRVLNNAFGGKKWYQRLTYRMQRFRIRIAGIRTNLMKFNPKELAKKLLKKIGAKLLSLLGSLISSIFTAIGTLLSTLFPFIAVLVVIIIVVGALTSIFNLLLNWWKDLQTEERVLVSNNPHYIMNQAVNYRNAELEIFELFHDAAKGDVQIAVNESPIYYALYDDSFDWFGLVENGEKIGSHNQPTYDLYQSTLPGGSVNDLAVQLDGHATGETPAALFHSSTTLDKYKTVNLSYYSAKDIKTDADGNYITEQHGKSTQVVLREDAIPSRYEISNAKDALAMVDAIYTNKSETMQKLEVLAYLGVGDYQLGKVTANGDNTEKEDIVNNLFWASHHFVYKSGNDESDVLYHATSTASSSPILGHKEYHINEYSKYKLDDNANFIKNADGTYAVEAIEDEDDCKCDNYRTIYYTYTVQENVSGYMHSSGIESYDPSGYGEYKNEYATSSVRVSSEITCAQRLQNWLICDASDADYLGEGDESQLVYSDLPCRQITEDKITSLYYDGDCAWLYFYRQHGNNYYVVNSNDDYMGVVSLSPEDGEGSLFDALTKIETESGVKKMNLTGTQINLDYFAIYWENDCYWMWLGAGYEQVDLFNNKGQEIVEIAKEQIGVPYKKGGGTAYTGSSSKDKCGLNCRGLVEYCFQEAGYDIEATPDGLYEGGLYGDDTIGFYDDNPWAIQLIDKENIMPGDLVCYTETNSGDYAGIYIGNGKMIYASNQNGKVCETKIFGNPHYVRITQLSRGYAPICDYDYDALSEQLPFEHSNVIFNPDGIVVNQCIHTAASTQDVKYTTAIDVCLGHIDLDVGMVVSLISDDGALFKDACNVYGLPENKVVKSFLGIAWDKEQDAVGFGDVEQFAFHPSEDWVDSELQELAKTKMQNELDYELPKDKDISDAAISIMRDNFYFQSVEESEEGKLLLGMNFNGRTYYVKSFVSGEQKYDYIHELIKTYKYENGQTVTYKSFKDGVLSFAIKNGIPHVTGSRNIVGD